MTHLLATLAAVFAVTLLGAPLMGAGWFWDVGNGVGFAAFAGLLYLAISSNRRLDIRAHQVLAYAVLALVVIHASWFLLGDATAVEFIKIGAPDYMWLGMVSLASLMVLMIVATPPDRTRLHRNYSAFKYWHRVLTVVVIAAATYHVIVSNFYLATWYQAGIFALLALAACFGRENRLWPGRIAIASPARYLALSALLILVFAGFRNLPA